MAERVQALLSRLEASKPLFAVTITAPNPDPKRGEMGIFAIAASHLPQDYALALAEEIAREIDCSSIQVKVRQMYRLHEFDDATSDRTVAVYDEAEITAREKAIRTREAENRVRAEAMNAAIDERIAKESVAGSPEHISQLAYRLYVASKRVESTATSHEEAKTAMDKALDELRTVKAETVEWQTEFRGYLAATGCEVYYAPIVDCFEKHFRSTE